jgi:uridylate kinase
LNPHQAHASISSALQIANKIIMEESADQVLSSGLLIGGGGAEAGATTATFAVLSENEDLRVTLH